MKLGPFDTFVELARATLIDAHSARDRDRNRGLRTQSVRCPLGVAPIDVPVTPAVLPWSRHGNVADHPLPGPLAQKIKCSCSARPRLCSNGIVPSGGNGSHTMLRLLFCVSPRWPLDEVAVGRLAPFAFTAMGKA
jgi:hypothetical protein